METVELLRILDEISKLKATFQEALNAFSPMPEQTKSSQINELLAALSKAQAEMKPAQLSSTNPFFKSKYADLAEVVQSTRPALTKHGLCVIQQITINEDGANILNTILGHSSGQWIKSQARILPAKPDIQSLGSYITFLKRYCYAALIGSITGEVDDDGEMAVHETREIAKKGVALTTKYNPKEDMTETITREQLDEALYELAEYPDILELVLDGLKIQSIADMPKSKFIIAMERIRQIKNTRNNAKG